MFLILTREKSSKIEKVKISPFEIKLIIEKKKKRKEECKKWHKITLFSPTLIPLKLEKIFLTSFQHCLTI